MSRPLCVVALCAMALAFTLPATAQQPADHKDTAEDLRLLANEQIKSGATEEALATCDRALAAAEKEKPADGQPDTAWRDERSKIYIAQGNAYLKLHRNDDAVESYNRSAELAANPAISYFNICAVLYNSGLMEKAIPACRRSVQVDPSRANAWFILGSALFTSAPMDAKGNATITDETRTALNKYLELEHDGPHAADVRAMLQMAK